MAKLDAGLAAWLDQAANGLDVGTEDPANILPRLTAAGVANVGVPAAQGGSGGDVTDAIELLANVSEHSMAAGFVLWGHRTFIEYLLQSPNRALGERLLPVLLAGGIAGATGLSNAMKFLSGLEELQIQAAPAENGFVVNGKLAWVTNLRRQAFVVAAAIARTDGGPAFCAAIASDADGVERSADLDLMAMRSTSTAAIKLTDVALDTGQVLHTEATRWLPDVRPAFLGLQCGMSIGLARRALAEARSAAGAGRHILHAPIDQLCETLAAQQRALNDGIRSGSFRTQAAPLFRIRIALAEIAAQAVSLELQAAGGRAYLGEPGQAFARRWREAAFVPIITPSLVQLKTVLAAQDPGIASGVAA